jgi:ketosteroid isomerase-like protein
MIASHEANMLAGDLDAIMDNMASDVVVLPPGSPPVEGNDACRSLYAGMLDMGRWKLVHDYYGAEVAGEAAILHGVARGTFTATDGSSEAIANNFLIIARPDRTGKVKGWRAVFAPSGD